MTQVICGVVGSGVLPEPRNVVKLPVRPTV
jgi:hypothetical protein